MPLMALSAPKEARQAHDGAVLSLREVSEQKSGVGQTHEHVVRALLGTAAGRGPEPASRPGSNQLAGWCRYR